MLKLVKVEKDGISKLFIFPYTKRIMLNIEPNIRKNVLHLNKKIPVRTVHGLDNQN